MRRVVPLLAAAPLLFSLGCLTQKQATVGHHPISGVIQTAFHGTAGQQRRFPVERTQVYFVAPEGMKVGWQVGDGQTKAFAEGQITVPGRFNFEQGAVYRLKLTDIPGHEGLELYPTLEVAPAAPSSAAYLAHNAVPIEFTDEDFDQVRAGNYVTKVIYLPDPEYQELAIAGVETLVSTRLAPGVDPIAEADRRGTILVIVRMGSIDLELPHAAPVYGDQADNDAHGLILPISAEGKDAQPKGKVNAATATTRKQ